MVILEVIFEQDCKEIINKIIEKYTFNSTEILLWIYINIYIFNEIKKDKINYEKQSFLQHLKNDDNFHMHYSKYKNINNEIYEDLYSNILKKYYSTKENKISIDYMEKIYENLLNREKRQDTGSYYTPKSIVRYMIFKSIIIYLDNKIDSKKNLFLNYFLNKSSILPMDYVLKAISVLENLKIADISCGAGIFLREAFNIIYDLNNELYKLIGRKFQTRIMARRILEKNLYGIDIQYKSSMITKILLLLNVQNLMEHTMEKLNLNIFHGDALTMDYKDGANIINDIDIIIGNPPYIGEKGNKELFDNIRQTEFGSKYYERNMDYFYFFVYKSYELLKDNGLLSYITTNYFVTADGAKKLRLFLKNNFSFREIINFDELNIFMDAKGQHNMIFISEKTTKTIPSLVINFKTSKMNMDALDKKLLLAIDSNPNIEINKISQDILYDTKGQICILSGMAERIILDKIEKDSKYIIDDLCFVNQGIVSGADRLNTSWGRKLDLEKDIGSGIFVLTDDELRGLNLDDKLIEKYVRKFYKNSHIKRYYTLENSNLNILYIDNNNLEDINKYPKLYEHFIKFKELLELRREVQKGTRKWYALQWPRNEEIFRKEKIIAPQRSIKNTFAYTKEDFYASADVYFISTKKPDISLLYLLGILNSSLGYFWLYHRGKKKGKQLELYATPLKSIPICHSGDSNKIKKMEYLVKKIIECKKDEDNINKLQYEIDKLVFNLYGLKTEEINIITDFIKSNIN